ncbi:MAG: hypothetical protein NZ570_02735 [Candidatus Caldarchaeum sp.]|nr:hypothetical protein [Candidatus Caldarchaeum sp.]
MTVRLRKSFIKLLEEDREFRYTVAGYLGLAEVLKRLDSIEQEIKSLREGQEKLWDILNQLWEGLNKLWEEVKSLREGQEKLWESSNKLWEGQNKLWESSNKLWEEVRSLREEQEKLLEGQNMLWEEVRSLRDGQNKLWEGQNKLWEEVKGLKLAVADLDSSVKFLAKQVGALSDTIGFGLEDIAKVVVPGWLLRHEGIAVDGELERRWFIVDGEEVEVNLYGEGEREGRRLVIVGDAKSRIYRREVEDFDEAAEKVAKVVGRELYKFLFGYLIHPSAEDEGRRRKVALIASYMR